MASRHPGATVDQAIDVAHVADLKVVDTLRLMEKRCAKLRTSSGRECLRSSVCRRKVLFTSWKDVHPSKKVGVNMHRKKRETTYVPESEGI